MTSWVQTDFLLPAAAKMLLEAGHGNGCHGGAWKREVVMMVTVGSFKGTDLCRADVAGV